MSFSFTGMVCASQLSIGTSKLNRMFYNSIFATKRGSRVSYFDQIGFAAFVKRGASSVFLDMLKQSSFPGLRRYVVYLPSGSLDGRRYSPLGAHQTAARADWQLYL